MASICKILPVKLILTSIISVLFAFMRNLNLSVSKVAHTHSSAPLFLPDVLCLKARPCCHLTIEYFLQSEWLLDSFFSISVIGWNTQCSDDIKNKTSNKEHQIAGGGSSLRVTLDSLRIRKIYNRISNWFCSILCF